MEDSGIKFIGRVSIIFVASILLITAFTSIFSSCSNSAEKDMLEKAAIDVIEYEMGNTEQKVPTLSDGKDHS